MDKYNSLQFKFYGDWHEINYIYGDCQKYLFFVSNDTKDGAPIFIYKHGLSDIIINDVDKLNLYLRDLKIRHVTKKDLNEDELSMYTFFRFYIKSKKEQLVKVIRNDPYVGYYRH